MSGLHIRRVRDGYAVFRDEQQVSGVSTRAQTEIALDHREQLEKRRSTTRQRKCLCCDEVFLSEGPHHRLCNHHRATVGGLGREMAG